MQAERTKPIVRRVSEPPLFRIGLASHEHLIVHPTRRVSPEAADYRDRNLDLPRSLGQIPHATLPTRCSRSFSSISAGVMHFHAACESLDEPGLGNHLAFSIKLDQTVLPSISRALEAVCAALPVVHAPR